MALISLSSVVTPMVQAVVEHRAPHFRTVAADDPRGDVWSKPGGATALQEQSVDIRRVAYSSDARLLIIAITVARLLSPDDEYLETTVREGARHVLIAAAPGALRLQVISGDRDHVCPGSGTTVAGSEVMLRVPVRCLPGFTRPTLTSGAVLAEGNSTPFVVDRTRTLGPFRL